MAAGTCRATRPAAARVLLRGRRGMRKGQLARGPSKVFVRPGFALRGGRCAREGAHRGARACQGKPREDRGQRFVAHDRAVARPRSAPASPSEILGRLRPYFFSAPMNIGIRYKPWLLSRGLVRLPTSFERPATCEPSHASAMKYHVDNDTRSTRMCSQSTRHVVSLATGSLNQNFAGISRASGHARVLQTAIPVIEADPSTSKRPAVVSDGPNDGAFGSGL